MKAYITELLGAFFLVLVIGMSGDPIAIGCVLMVMVYMGAHISGAHYNPAVTLGILLLGKTDTGEALKYMAAQVSGAFLAGLLVWWMTGTTFVLAPGAGFTVLQILVAEFLFTFALVLVLMNVAVSDATAGNSYYGFAIGFTVLAGAYAVGPISGGAFNPAVGLGPAFVNTMTGNGTLVHVWLYLVGPFGGGAIAALVFKIQEG